MVQRGKQVALERRIPWSVAAIVARLTQDQPSTLTRDQVNEYLVETGSQLNLESVLRELVALGWLTSTPRHGVWAFIAPGEVESSDPYLGLRAWQASDPAAVFALAGEAVAWHLGLVARRYDGPVALWIPKGTTVPRGLRQDVATVTLGWNADQSSKVGPERAWLMQRKLDLTRWSNGIPAFGPEALLVQLGVRPTSFHPWADLAPNLQVLANSISLPKLLDLLAGQKTTAYQRVAYFLSLGGQAPNGDKVLAARPTEPLSHVVLGDGKHSTFSATHRLTDRLLAPFLAQFGKA
jgi:AbiEi antitoxin C-terminal domain